MIVTTTNRMQAPAGTVLHVVGEVDTFAAEDLRRQLLSLSLAPEEQLVIDLSAVTFMSCTALSVLAETQARLGSRLFLGRCSKVVARLLDVTALTPLFPVASGNSAERVPYGRAGSTYGGRPRTRATTTWTFTRTDIHRVRGLLMAIHGCDAEQAWGMVSLTAARHGVPVGELVELLIRGRGDSGCAPSSEAALAALTILMRKPADDEGDPSDVAAGGPGRPAERVTTL
jgi:anti-anti-sigma factor